MSTVYSAVAAALLQCTVLMLLLVKGDTDMAIWFAVFTWIILWAILFTRKQE